MEGDGQRGNVGGGATGENNSLVCPPTTTTTTPRPAGMVPAAAASSVSSSSVSSSSLTDDAASIVQQLQEEEQEEDREKKLRTHRQSDWCEEKESGSCGFICKEANERGRRRNRRGDAAADLFVQLSHHLFLRYLRDSVPFRRSVSALTLLSLVLLL